MAEFLSNDFDKTHFRRYFHFESGNFNHGYHPQLKAARQWKNAAPCLKV